MNYVNEKEAQMKPNFDFGYFETLQEEVEAADVVVTGEILGKTNRGINIGEDSEEDIFDYDVYSMKVISVAKGNIEVGTVIEAKQLVGVNEFTDYSVKIRKVPISGRRRIIEPFHLTYNINLKAERKK